MTIDEILKKYNFLDDFNYILRSSSLQYSRSVKKYKADLEELLIKNIASKNIRDQVLQEFNKFTNSIKLFFTKEKINKTVNAKTITNLIINKFTNDYQSFINNIITKQLAKKSSIELMSNIESLTTEQINSTNKNVKINIFKDSKGKNLYLTNKQLKSINNDAYRLFGDHSTTKYKTGANNRTGSNYPITAHIENVETTMSATINRDVTRFSSNRLGIYTVKVSDHGGIYSCALHENEIVLINEQARQEMLKQFPENKSEINRMRTIDDLKNDDTRIFKFNCSHRYRAYPVQFMSKKKLNNDLSNNRIEKIPKNKTESELQKLLV